jgi:hypothetical protein
MKDVDPSDKPPKIQKTDLSLEESCGFCGRNTEIKLNGKSYPHTKKLCFCKLHVDKNVSDLPWSKSPMGISYKSLGLNFLPNNKKLSGDKKSMVDYSMPKEESSGNHLLSDDFDISIYLSSLSKKLTNDLSVFVKVSISLILKESPSRKRSLMPRGHESLALLDSGALAGDFISLAFINELDLHSFVVKIDNPKRVCSGLDNTCNLISGSIELILNFINEITNKIETFYFNPRILQNSPIDIIIGHSTIKNKNLAWKIPRGFFLDSFIKRNKNLFLTSQEPVVSDISYQFNTKLSKRLKITEISEKPCTDHICGCQPISGLLPNDVTRTRAHKNKVKVAVNRLSDIPSSTFVDNGPCGTPEIIPITTEPRVGTVLSEEGNTSLTDTRSHTLTTVAQTHTVLRHHTELQPYKLDDGIILGCLFSSLSISTLSETPNLYNTVFALTDSHTTSLKTEISNNFVDNDGISDYHDSFKPWLPDPQPTTNLLDSIHIEGDEELQNGIRALCEEYKDIFSNTLPAIPSKMEPFDIKVDTVAWKNPKNRMPHRRQSPKKEMEILRQVTLLEEQGIIKRSNAQYYSQVILAPKPDDEWRLCVDFRNLNNATLENGTPSYGEY